MKTPYGKIVSRLRVISEVANQESEGITQMMSGGTGIIQLGSDASREAFFEPRPCDAALQAFLNALPESALTALMGLMYAGRDGEKDVPGYIAHLRETIDSREGMAGAIGEKTPRMQYIDQGIAYLGGLNLEAFYTGVVAKHGADGEE